MSWDCQASSVPWDCQEDGTGHTEQSCTAPQKPAHWPKFGNDSRGVRAQTWSRMNHDVHQGPPIAPCKEYSRRGGGWSRCEPPDPAVIPTHSRGFMTTLTG